MKNPFLMNIPKIYSRGVALALLLAFSVSITHAQQLALSDLAVEYLHHPMGLDVLQPRMSWKLKSDDRATMQTSYEIRVGKDAASTAAGRNLV